MSNFIAVIKNIFFFMLIIVIMVIYYQLGVECQVNVDNYDSSELLEAQYKDDNDSNILADKITESSGKIGENTFVIKQENKTKNKSSPG